MLLAKTKSKNNIISHWFGTPMTKESIAHLIPKYLCSTLVVIFVTKSISETLKSPIITQFPLLLHSPMILFKKMHAIIRAEICLLYNA